MESTTTVVYGVQANSPAPLFRVIGGAVVSSCRPVSGQECFGFSGSVSRVESVSGAIVAGAAQALGLRGYVGEQVRQSERAHVRPVQGEAPAQLVRGGRREVLLAQVDGDGNGNGSFNGSDSDNGTNGTKPMTPWGYRTSSPPG
ncbi:hypothetical protein [Catenulispora subtropica]|uniref:Uncharacterized protein n=1 Tax=Catenulispora subtropica TaxID=450798 RepID=A0ABP5ESY0_9ACTN